MSKPKLYRVEIQIAATAYIKAASAADALNIARALKNEGMEVNGDDIISGLSFNDADLPDVSLSPAMTIQGLFDATADAELVDE